MLSAKQTAPGQSGQIEVSVKTEGLTAVNKLVTVTTNDPKNRQVALTITASVQPEFILSDRTIYFGSVPQGTEQIRSLLITIPEGKSVKILGADSTDASFAAKVEPVPDSDGRKIKLIGVMKGSAATGYHFGMLVVKTSSTFTPELKIPVRGMVVAAQND